MLSELKTSGNGTLFKENKKALLNLKSVTNNLKK